VRARTETKVYPCGRTHMTLLRWALQCLSHEQVCATSQDGLTALHIAYCMHRYHYGSAVESWKASPLFKLLIEHGANERQTGALPSVHALYRAKDKIYNKVHTHVVNVAYRFRHLNLKDRIVGGSLQLASLS
jgi:hypothetical protein